MRFRAIKFFIAATSVYALFLVRGLPSNHYLDWSLDFKIGDCLEIIILTVPVSYLLLKWLSAKPDYFRDSIWLALSFSLPYAVFDLVFLGIIKGYGLGYPSTFWLLTIFYPIALIEIPVIGYLMQKDDPETMKRHLLMLSVAIVAWLLNWWEGAFSDHYAGWSLNMKIIRLMNVVLILLAVMVRLRSKEGNIFGNACWLALYLSITFVLFDFLYLGIAKGRGPGYVLAYWHVTAFYPIFWIEIPLIGWLVKRRSTPTGMTVEQNRAWCEDERRTYDLAVHTGRQREADARPDRSMATRGGLHAGASWP